jgi:hypothetical protein
LIRSGIAGTSIVSAYITIVATELRIATTFHAEAGIFFPEYGIDDCNVGLSLVVLLLSSHQNTKNKIAFVTVQKTPPDCDSTSVPGISITLFSLLNVIRVLVFCVAFDSIKRIVLSISSSETK